MSDHEYRDRELEHPVIALGLVLGLARVGTIVHLLGLAHLLGLG